MSGYQKIIAEATGVENAEDLAEIEDVMRHSIFHSTLDWQTHEQLDVAAREGWEIVQLMRDPAVMAQYAA